jgi:Family of unknown function (DUF6459)
MSAPLPESTPVATVRVRAAPRREPPFDDEQPQPQLMLVGHHDRPLPFAAVASDRRLRDVFVARPTGRGNLPDPQVFGRRLLIGVFEALGGRRTLPQLAPHLSQRVYAGLLSDVERRGSGTAWHTPPTIRSVRVCEPADGVAELAAVIQVGRRCRAVAARLEALNGRWRCVKLQVG